MPERRAEGQLVDAGTIDIIIERKDHGSRALGGAELAVPVGAFQDDRRDVGQCLDIVDRRGLAVESDGHGEWRLLSRPGFFPFEDLEHGGVLSGDIIMRRGNDFDIEVKTAIENVFPKITGVFRFAQSIAYDLYRSIVPSVDVKISLAGADRVSTKDSTFKH